jgi:L-ascorbate metabolism protein UlaG (beta-lactamase superfamily)
MRYENLAIEKIFHAAVKVRGSVAIYFDPYNLPTGAEQADLILITHEHFDHCSVDDIKKIADAQTVIIATEMCREKLGGVNVKEIKYVRPGESLSVGEITIEVVPAYNIDKFRSPGVPFHPREHGKAGYVVDVDGVRVYHAGDTDFIPEMQDLKNIDVALLPVSGVYVMTPAEAASAAKAINPKLAIPIHFGDLVGRDGTIIGVPADGEEFKRLAQPVIVEII